MNTRIDRFHCITVAILIMFVAGFAATACAPAVTPQPTADPATSVAAQKMTEDTLRLQARQTSIAEEAAQFQQQTAAAQTQAAIPTATSTPTKTATPRPTRTPDVRPTLQYEAMKAKVDKYVKAAYLTSSAGTYHRLDDYVGQWAQLGYYAWERTDFQPADFVIESDIEWVSASESANLFNTGCGFVFHAKEGTGDHYMAVLGMDGYVHSNAYYSGYFNNMGKGWFGKVDFPQGKAHIALLVEKEKYHFLVNDKLVKKYNGLQNKLLDGDLAYTVLSGTNKDFGTACRFSNTELWIIKE